MILIIQLLTAKYQLKTVVNISEQVNNIEKKTRLLVARLSVLQKENATLKASNKELVEQNRNLNADLLLRDSEISHLKTQTVSVVAGEGVRTEARERSQHLREEIDQHIQEIDKCIEWLQNQ
jgi:chromosome segregation ATPase